MAHVRGGPTDATLPADSASASSPALDKTVLAGRYEILGLLGTGGMGRVYRAHDRELGEPIALKVLHRDLLASDEMVDRFRQEVRLARRVTHRNVARTFDIGEHEGEKFLTMELVDGEPLSNVVGRGPLPVERAIAIARAIVAGTSAAHSVGVVHRDLKPDNVLVDVAGRVVITDFGIARVDVIGAASRTNGRVVGTPAYMAPEQVEGRPDVDARADIYAVGTIVYEMLTGERAWPGDAAFVVAAARLVQPPPDPRRVRPSIPAAVADVVVRCLQRRPEDRFASDAELDAALAAIDVASFLAPTTPPEARAPIVPGRNAERSIAVMPFRNLGPAEDAYLADGLTEDLLASLAMVRGLRVRARAIDPAERDAETAGRRLGVDVVVEGSMRRAGDSLRVSARLVGVADGFHLWAARFDRPVGDAFALNDDVANAIAGALAAKAGAARAQPSDPRAIELYLRGRAAFGNFWRADAFEGAEQLFADAIALAPDDPTILAGFVQARLGKSFRLGDAKPQDILPLVRRALLAGESLPEPWIALAAARFNVADDAAGAMPPLRRAIALAPSSAEAHDLAGRLLLEAGEIEEAIAYLDRTLWLDPSIRWARVDRVRAAAYLGDWAKAEALLDADVGPAWTPHRMIAQSRMWLWPGAPRIELPPPPPDADERFGALYALTRRLHAQGAFDDAHWAALDRFVGGIAQGGRPLRLYTQVAAELSARAGNDDRALAFIRRSVEAGLLDLTWMDRQRLFDRIRNTPEYAELREIVFARARPIVAAWRGPAETLESALARLDRHGRTSSRKP